MKKGFLVVAVLCCVFVFGIVRKILRAGVMVLAFSTSLISYVFKKLLRFDKFIDFGMRKGSQYVSRYRYLPYLALHDGWGGCTGL